MHKVGTAGLAGMRPIRRLLLGIGLLLLVLLAVAFALPQTISVARTVVINAPEVDVFPFVNEPRRIAQWLPWIARAGDATVVLEGPNAGVGAQLHWQGQDNEEDAGRLEVVESRPNSFVRVAVEFADMGAVVTTYQLAPAGAGTRLTWSFATDAGNNPLMRWGWLYFARGVGSDMERALERLRHLVEASR